jgi:hypothetical protein
MHGFAACTPALRLHGGTHIRHHQHDMEKRPVTRVGDALIISAKYSANAASISSTVGIEGSPASD